MSLDLPRSVGEALIAAETSRRALVKFPGDDAAFAPHDGTIVAISGLSVLAFSSRVRELEERPGLFGCSQGQRPFAWRQIPSCQGPVFVYFEHVRQGCHPPHQAAARALPPRGREPSWPGVGGRF